MKPLLRLTTFTVAFVLLTGCGGSMSPEEARQRLADLNVEYSADSFVDHASEGDRAVVELFLAAGMDPSSSDAGNALAQTIQGGHAEVAKMLTEAGAELEGSSEQQGEMLMKAISNDNTETAQLLLEAGANPDAKMNELTATLFAIAKGQPEVLRALLDAGADPSITSKRSEPVTPLIVAAGGDDLWQLNTPDLTREERTQMVEALLEAGADPNFGGGNGDNITALMAASAAGYPQIASRLIEGGADVSIETDHGETALNFARESGNDEVVSLLE